MLRQPYHIQPRIFSHKYSVLHRQQTPCERHSNAPPMLPEYVPHNPLLLTDAPRPFLED